MVVRRFYFLAALVADAFPGAFLAALIGGAFVAFPPMSMLSTVTPFFFKAAENHCGRLPRPDQVWAAFAGLRYFGATTTFGLLAPLPPRRG